MASPCALPGAGSGSGAASRPPWAAGPGASAPPAARVLAYRAASGHRGKLGGIGAQRHCVPKRGANGRAPCAAHAAPPRLAEAAALPWGVLPLDHCDSEPTGVLDLALSGTTQQHRSQKQSNPTKKGAARCAAAPAPPPTAACTPAAAPCCPWAPAWPAAWGWSRARPPPACLAVGGCVCERGEGRGGAQRDDARMLLRFIFSAPRRRPHRRRPHPRRRRRRRPARHRRVPGVARCPSCSLPAPCI